MGGVDVCMYGRKEKDGGRVYIGETSILLLNPLHPTIDTSFLPFSYMMQSVKGLTDQEGILGE